MNRCTHCGKLHSDSTIECDSCGGIEFEYIMKVTPHQTKPPCWFDPCMICKDCEEFANTVPQRYPLPIREHIKAEHRRRLKEVGQL